jgi:hypothetical protein
MEIPNKYVDKTVLKACAVLEASVDNIGRISWLGEDSDEDFDIDNLVNRLTEMLVPWAARMVDEKFATIISPSPGWSSKLWSFNSTSIAANSCRSELPSSTTGESGITGDD